MNYPSSNILGIRNRFPMSICVVMLVSGMSTLREPRETQLVVTRSCGTCDMPRILVSYQLPRPAGHSA